MKIKLTPDSPAPSTASSSSPRDMQVIPRVITPKTVSQRNTGQPEDSSRKLIQKQLVLLLHSHACLKKDVGSSPLPEDHPRCPVPNCQMMKEVWVHMKSCKIGLTCTHLHCSSSQKILAHWKSCQVDGCSVCHIVRVKWAQMVVAKEALSETDHLSIDSSSSSGQSTTSSSQGLGHGQGRSPHGTIELGSGRVDSIPLVANSNNQQPQYHHHNDTMKLTMMGSSSLLDGQEAMGTCHGNSTMLQNNQQHHQHQNHHHLCRHQKQSHHHHQRHAAYHPNTHLTHQPIPYVARSYMPVPHLQSQRSQVQPIMSHYYVDDNDYHGNSFSSASSGPVMMTMTLNREENGKRKICDFMSPSNCIPPKVRISSFNTRPEYACSNHPTRDFSTRHCQCAKCLLSGGTRQQHPQEVNRSSRIQPQEDIPYRIHPSIDNEIEKETKMDFQSSMHLNNSSARLIGVPKSSCDDYDDGSVPSANDVRLAYERLGIPCPSDALNRLMATLPGGSKLFMRTNSNYSSNDSSSECGSGNGNNDPYEMQSNSSTSRRNSEADDGINVEDIEYKTIDDDCQVSFCLSLVQRLMTRKVSQQNDCNVDPNEGSSQQ